MPLTLVTGPVRSGKSRFVVNRAQSLGKAVCYVATAARDAGDAEWVARIERHMRDRPSSWSVVESAALDKEAFLEVFRSAGADRCIIVDALGTWIATRIAANVESLTNDFSGFEHVLDDEATEVAAAMLGSSAEVIVVAEEVGWDVVPVAPSARLFRDVLGRMKQRLAAEAAAVYLVVCGHALDVRALGVMV